jgi:hypothetical protein
MSERPGGGEEGGRSRYDDSPCYCRKLGHAVTFRYCRGVTDGLPCALVLDCWYETFDVASHLRGCYSSAELERIFAPPPHKLGQIAGILAALDQAAREG